MAGERERQLGAALVAVLQEDYAPIQALARAWPMEFRDGEPVAALAPEPTPDPPPAETGQREALTEVVRRLRASVCGSIRSGSRHTCREHPTIGAGSWCTECLGHAACDALAALASPAAPERCRATKEVPGLGTAECQRPPHDPAEPHVSGDLAWEEAPSAAERTAETDHRLRKLLEQGLCAHSFGHSDTCRCGLTREWPNGKDETGHEAWVRHVQSALASPVAVTATHALRWQPARFGKMSAHCSCGAECPDDTPALIEEWFRQHLVSHAAAERTEGRETPEDDMPSFFWALFNLFTRDEVSKGVIFSRRIAVARAMHKAMLETLAGEGRDRP